MERFAQLQGRGGEGSCGLIRKKMSDADALNNLQHDGRTDEEWAELRWQIDPARHEYGVTSESQFSSSHQLNMGSLFNILFFGRFDGTQSRNCDSYRLSLSNQTSSSSRPSNLK